LREVPKKEPQMTNANTNTCSKCDSHRLAAISGKCSDRCYFMLLSNPDRTHDGYVPNGIGLADESDYVEFVYCLNCGQIQGEFPVSEESINRVFDPA
jgi:hypothetical protein